MTLKDRAKCKAKGILTIAQLSYGYRPRRRKRTRPDTERSTKSAKRTAPAARHDHKLKALAIKKSQIHVVGALSLKFEGIPTFLDVEGMPDRDFYYLVGLRFECDGEQEERSFWADGCGWRARNVGELPADAQGDRECTDRQLWCVRGSVSQTDEKALHLGARRRGIRRSAHRNVDQPRRLHLREGLFPDVFEQPQGSRPIPRLRVDLATGFGRRCATTAEGLGALRGRRAQARTDPLQHGRLPSGRDGRGRLGAYLLRRRVWP